MATTTDTHPLYAMRSKAVAARDAIIDLEREKERVAPTDAAIYGHGSPFVGLAAAQGGIDSFIASVDARIAAR